MRAAIFLGLGSIADAIRSNWTKGAEGPILFFFILFLIMDTIEFVHKLIKK